MARSTKKNKKVASKKTARRTTPARVTRSSSTASLAASMAKTTPMMSSSPVSTPAMSGPNLTQMAMMYLTFLLGNSVVVYGANMLFPSQVVLGTNIITPFMALVYSMVVFTLIGVGAMPIIQMAADSLKMKLSNNAWMVIYLVINVVALWVVGRFAEMLGLGLASWMVALVLGAVINIVQSVLYKLSTPKMVS